jgi:hypothetical protein
VSKVETLESKIRAVLDTTTSLRRENHRLRSEVESLKGHVALLTGENTKAQRVLAEHEHLKKIQQQVTHRVERALSALNNLRPS